MDLKWLADPLTVFGLWQPTVWLLAALIFSFAWPRRPARAHALLVLMLAGVLLTPLTTLTWHRMGWGVLSPHAVAAVERFRTTPVSIVKPPPVEVANGHHGDLGVGPQQALQPPGDADGAMRLKGPPATILRLPHLANWRSAAWALWGLASIVLALSTLAGMWRARRLLGRLSPHDDAHLQACLDEAAAQLELRRTPVLAVADVGVPVIWCWGRRPLILVPPHTSTTAGEIDWVGVFRHELAHWKRRDHLARLLARLVTILLPFHPLAWCVARRLSVLSERACDAWAVADGRSPLDYAESLLRLCPARRPRLALAAVSGRRPLCARVRRLLNHSAAPPDTGRRWIAAMTVCTAIFTAALALAQPRGKAPQDEPSASGDQQPADAARMTVTGSVLLPGDMPAAGAQVAILGQRRMAPRGGDFSRNDAEVLGLAIADATGKFELKTARTNSAEYRYLFALAALTGYARGLTPLDCDAQSPAAVVRLARDEELSIALIDVQGEPAAGVELFVERIGMMVNPGFAEGVSFSNPPEGLPLWPRRMKSDERGRVALDGFNRALVVSMVVDDPRFARQWIALGGPDGAKEPTVTLPPSQIIEGTVTYADNGAAAPHARLTVYASQREHSGGSGVAAAADEHGHFHINPHAGAYMEITAYADDGAPYLTMRKRFEWPKGAARHEIDLALPRGVLAHGKVVDQTGALVAGAAIQYVPLRRNPNKQDSLVFGWDNVGLSNERGEFALPVLPGEGHLLIQGPNGDFIHREIGDRVLNDDQPGGWRYYPDAVVRLDVPASKDSVRVEAALRRGVVVKGRLVGPAGQPVHRALIISRLQIANFEFYGRSPTELVDGNFELHGLDPEQPYPVMFLDVENEWGATATISGRQAGEPVAVRLSPCGTASGMFIGTDGKPLKDYRPTLEIVVTPGVARHDIDALRKGMLAADGDYVANLDRQHYWTGPKTDDEGRVALPALIPGATYRITLRSDIKAEFTAKSGKNIELRDITIPAE